MRSLRTCALTLACAVGIGCGTGVEGEPAPSCITDPQHCPDTDLDAGVRPIGAIVVESPSGLDVFPTPDAPPPPRGDGGQRLGDGGRAECPIGQERCDGVCTDVQSDSRNCGICGFVCDFGTACTLGVCTPADPFDPS